MTEKLTAQRGFTLIELLILVGIAIPQFSSYRAKSYNSATQSDLRNFKMVMKTSFVDDDTYLNFRLTKIVSQV